MFLDVLFVLCVAVGYSEPLLTRVVGKTIFNLLAVIAALGLCSLLAVFFMKAL